MAEGSGPMVQVESYLEYKLLAAFYDPQRADIKENIARIEGELKPFDPGGAQYAAGLADISRLQDWLGERDKARMNRVRAFEIFENNFYPAASSVKEFKAYIGLLNDSAPASASCAKANELFKTLFEKDPDNVLIYESIPACQLDGIRTKKGLARTKAWFDAGRHKFAGMELSKATAAADILIERLNRSAEQTPRDYLLIARLCEITGGLQDAANYIEKGLTLFPNDPQLNTAARNLKIKG
jgi:tetratricopeptide (TPR) repeat protein